MSIPSLLSSASALRSHQRMLDVVGNNLANVNTIAFKSQTVRFGTQFFDVLRSATAPSGSVGGVNPAEVGRGVNVLAIDNDLSQGAIINSGNALDLALTGPGFFTLDSAQGQVFSRAGSFGVDANNQLVDTATGALVQRIGSVGEATATLPAFQVPGDSSIRIPFGTTIPGNATTRVGFAGNLDSEAIGPLQEELTSTINFQEGASPATDATLLNALTSNTIDYVAGDVINISGTRVDGSVVEVAFGGASTDLSTATVGDLLDSINTGYLSGSLGIGATAIIDTNGTIFLRADDSGEALLTLSIVDGASNIGRSDFGAFTLTTDGKDGDTASSAITVFDDQGSPHAMVFTFEKRADNLWNMTASIDPSEGTFEGFGLDNLVAGIAFNEDGSFAGISGASTVQIVSTTLPYTTGTSPTTTPALGTDTLNSLTQNTIDYVAGDAIEITGTDFNGAPVAITFDNGGSLDTATVDDLITAINTGYTGASAALDANGNIVLTATGTGQGSLTLNLADAAGNTGSTTFGNLVEVQAGTNGDINITYEITSLVGFGTRQSINLDLGDIDGFNGLTQFGGFDNVAAVEQNGFAPGSLTDVSVGEDGVISGNFDNGRILPLAQLAIATFSNAAGLQRLENNYYRESTNSGIPILTTAKSGGAGSVLGNSIEQSNVDVAVEFTQLIIAQRGFQVNARAFITSDQVLEELANLKR